MVGDCPAKEDDVPEMNHVSLKAEHKAGDVFSLVKRM